jgi:undecaprenyl pyrophosphate phosphatase UppP
MLTEAHSGNEWLAIAVGFTVAIVSGLLAISFLLAWLRSRSVTVFSVYRIGLAVAVVILVVAGR